MKKSITDELEGRFIKKFYRTEISNHSFYHPDGLGELNWYELIIETENSYKYNFGEDFIEKWQSEKRLIETKPF